MYSPIKYPLNDETQLAIPTGAAIPPPVAVFGVPGAQPIVRTETPKAPLVVDGDGQGVVNATAAGLLANNPTIFYAASAAGKPAVTKSQLAQGAVLVLTDTNAKQLSTWGTVVDNYGYVEPAKETPLVANPSEVALPVVPGAGTDTQTVALVSQVASVRATAYGNPITNTPENQPFNAVDGNVDTAWTEGAFSPAINESLQIALTHRVTTNHITLLQPQKGSFNRHVSEVTLTFDGKNPVTVPLGAAQATPPGQVVTFPTRSFRTLTVTVDATSSGTLKTYDGQSAVGFAEVTIPGVPPATETLRLPTDLLKRTGAASTAHQLDILLNRDRAQDVPPRTDPELTINRQFTLPAARTFSIGGLARISTLDTDQVINTLLGRTSLATDQNEATVVDTSSSGRLPGDLGASAAAADDGNPTTSWMPGLGPQKGVWIDYALSKAVTFDHLNLTVVADGRHSIPTSITISTSSGSRTVALPKIDVGHGRPQGSVTSVPVSFPALTGTDVRVTVNTVDPVHLLDYISDGQNTEPVGIAEVGIPGVATESTPTDIPTTCQPNLLEVDGKPIDIEISGTASTALSNGGLTITGCGNSANGIVLSSGTHIVTTSPYTTAGLNVDSLLMASAAGGTALGLTSSGQVPPEAVPVDGSPSVKVLSSNRSGMKVSVNGAAKGFWLVLGESQSRGWVASIESGASLGASQLIDGYANGWYVPAASAKAGMIVDIEWQPQRVIDAAILASTGALVIVLGLILIPPGFISDRLARRRARHARRTRRRATDRSGGGGDSALGTTVGTVKMSTTDHEIAPVDPDVRPRLSVPLTSGGRKPSWAWAIGVAVLGGLFASLIVAPLAGLAIALVLLLGLLVDRSRIVIVVSAVGFIAVTGLVMVVGQINNAYVPDVNWPAHFPLANSLAWFGICLLAADAVIVAVRRRSSSRPDPDGDPPSEAEPDGDGARADAPLLARPPAHASVDVDQFDEP